MHFFMKAPMSPLIENITKLKQQIPKHVTLVIASKYATLDDIKTIANEFPTIPLGENRVQHGEEKHMAHPSIQNPWHFIGHLQRNKVKKVIQNYSLIHSVDSERLLMEINEISAKKNQPTNLLLQVNPLDDHAKFGFNEFSIFDIVNQSQTLENINVLGLMCMAPFDASNDIIKKTFKKTRQIYDKLKSNGLPMEQLSMGMSNDYKIAIDEGSTMIRIGSMIFA